MSSTLANRLVSKLAWTEAHLVEGTQAFLWPASGEDAADAEEQPHQSDAVAAVLSWVRPKILRFEMLSPEPLPELLLVSTLAVGGPAYFVARKSYQVSTTVVCDPPAMLTIVERRDLFRVPVAARVTLALPSGDWSAYSLDCSVGGLRLCPPQPMEVGSEVEVKVELAAGTAVTLPAVVRYCRPYGGDLDSFAAGGGPDDSSHPKVGAHLTAGSHFRDGAHLNVVGLEYVSVPSDVQRHLSSFVGHHQRRLMPRVRVVKPLEYRSHGRKNFVHGVTTELSPGDVVLTLHEAYDPGDRLELRLRLGRTDYEFAACAVSCQTTFDEDGTPATHIIRASFDDGGDLIEGKFRTAIRELALEQIAAKRL